MKTIREILNCLIQDCQNMDEKIEVVNMSIDLALKEIAEIIGEMPISEQVLEKKVSNQFSYGLGYRQAKADLVAMIKGKD